MVLNDNPAAAIANAKPNKTGHTGLVKQKPAAAAPCAANTPLALTPVAFSAISLPIEAAFFNPFFAAFFYLQHILFFLYHIIVFYYNIILSHE